MRVDISRKHLSLNERLARESNNLAGRFNSKNYSKAENIEGMLLKRGISVERKKGILIKKLHELVVKAFSIDKRKFSKKSFDSLKKRLHSIRRITIKLRSINYYLETAFLDDLKDSKIKIGNENIKLQKSALAGDELEALEYTAYKLISEVVMLDKRLLSEYAHREKRVVKEEKADTKSIGSVLKKESELLEHLEAKLPPPKSATMDLMKEPVFTHWVARIFAILSYLEHMHSKEAEIFSKLKKNKAVKAKISKKIMHLSKEKSKLIGIMEEKLASMKKFRIDNKFRKELHNLTTTINL